jgi:hypothetical protein
VKRSKDLIRLTGIAHDLNELNGQDFAAVATPKCFSRSTPLTVLPKSVRLPLLHCGSIKALVTVQWQIAIGWWSKSQISLSDPSAPSSAIERRTAGLLLWFLALEIKT